VGGDPEAPELEEIPIEECLRLVASMSVGRVAVAVADQAPLVVPVNYVLDGEFVVFRSDPGAKVERALRQHTSFQVDLVDPFHRTGWSVLVRGLAHELTDAQAEHLPLISWVGDPRHWVRLVPTAITGRRIRLQPIDAEARGYL